MYKPLICHISHQFIVRGSVAPEELSPGQPRPGAFPPKRSRIHSLLESQIPGPTHTAKYVFSSTQVTTMIHWTSRPIPYTLHPIPSDSWLTMQHDCEDSPPESPEHVSVWVPSGETPATGTAQSMRGVMVGYGGSGLYTRVIACTREQHIYNILQPADTSS